MNDVLLLKGQFEHSKNPTIPGAPRLPKGRSVKASDINKFITQLREEETKWELDSTISKALLDVHYNRIIAKSNRMCRIFNINCDDHIVGARFDKTKSKHIITYCFDKEEFKTAIDRLDECKKIIENMYNGEISPEDMEQISTDNWQSKTICKTLFMQCVKDCVYISHFTKDRAPKELNETSLISVYDTGVDLTDLLRNLGIFISNDRIIDKTTVQLQPKEISILNNKAPYLIAMAVSDISKYSKEDLKLAEKDTPYIPDPINEPVIGVIDTVFDTSVYFSKWVDYENTVSSDIEIDDGAYDHGTMISSIIVDGPSFNPKLDDGCGRFRVKHFGVLAGKVGSTFTILKTIQRIVSENKNIKVWNLSLGSKQEVPENYISPEAAILDKIQYENDVTFIVAGTNKDRNDKEEKRIGAPADSINSIVVNSVNFENKTASYTRIGPVLSFYNKPDLCYYGGDLSQEISAYSTSGRTLVFGTSYAAPWIARKMAYLINIMGLRREVAKAMLIDSAAGWTNREELSTRIGYGTVPIKIDEIIRSKDDEIRFILMGHSNTYNTYNYNIPIPIANEAHPFVARATLCYYPKCARNQGVDYTNTEMVLRFGRINDKGKVQSLKGNKEEPDDIDELSDFTEEHVRRYFRKWDNIKYIADSFTSKTRARKAYTTKNWGIRLTTMNRLKSEDGENLPFGIVITLKEISGKNRINEFIQQCSLRGWLVNRINVKNLVEVYNKAEEHLEWE
jgi:hypothetical protein